MTLGVLLDSESSEQGGAGRLVAVAFAGGLSGLLMACLAALSLLCVRLCRALKSRCGRRGRPNGLGGAKAYDDEDEEPVELMPVRYDVDGRDARLLAVDLDRCRSLAAVRQALFAAYADVSGEQLLPGSASVEYDDDADGMCKLESNGPIVDGRLRSARSLQVAARTAKGTAGGR